MKKSIGVGGLVLASAAFLVAACGSPGYRYSYYDRPYYSRAYVYDDCSSRFRPAYCGYPRFGGAVVIAGESYRGLRYREGPYGREFWFDGRWVRA
jgi:hypothetical protein